MDYNFTADVEKSFDNIAEGKEVWTDMMQHFYKDFNPLVEKTLNTKEEHRVGERILGKDPKTGLPVAVKIGRFGAVVQIGSNDDEQKPRFARLKPEQSIETITLEEALDLFGLPRDLGKMPDGESVIVGTGRFGPYLQYQKTYVSVPKEYDPLTLTLDDAKVLIQQKLEEDAKKMLKSFDEEPELHVLDGRFGPYLQYKGNNFRLTKADQKRAAELTFDECMNIINTTEEKAAAKTQSRGRRSYTKRK